MNHKRKISRCLVAIMIFTLFVELFYSNNMVAEAASYKITEEELFTLAPTYLNIGDDEEYMTIAFSFANDAMDNLDANTPGAVAFAALKDGGNYILSWIGNKAGFNDSKTEQHEEAVAKEVLRNYLGNKQYVSNALKNVKKDWGFISDREKVYETVDLPELRKKIVEGTSYKEDQIADMVTSDSKMYKTALKRVGTASEAIDLICEVLMIEQIELDALDELINLYKDDPRTDDTYRGLLRIRTEVTSNLGDHVYKYFMNNTALDMIQKYTLDKLCEAASEGAYAVVKMAINITAKIYYVTNANVDEIVEATMAFSIAKEALHKVDAYRMGFLNKTYGLNDVKDFEVAYNYYLAACKVYFDKAKAGAKSDTQLKEKLNNYSSAIGNSITYQSYIKSCRKAATKAIDAGNLTINNDTVVLKDKNGTIIDNNYDSTANITSKLAEIQSKYKPNVGQRWTGSYQGCIQCCGFAKMVFNKLFDYDVSGYVGDKRYMLSNESNVIKVGQLTGNDVTVANVKSLFANAKIGDYIQVNGSTYGQHSAIFVGLDTNGAIIYDCNSKLNGTGDCLINQWTLTYNNMVSWYGKASSESPNGISVYRATNYASIYGDGSDLFYDDTVNFEIENGVLVKYNGWQSHVVIPDEVIEIGAYAFRYNENMISVEIPDSVKKIGDEAFYGCTGLVAVYIPDSVEEIGSAVFANCSNLVTAHVSENSKYTTLSYRMFDGCSELESINLSENLTKIEGSALNNCTSFDSIIIPDTITSIGNYAFANCTNASELKLSKNLVNMGYSVFNNCDSIESVEIPKSLEYCQRELYTVFVTIFNPGPFGGCDNLKKVSFEEGITNIPQYLFADCNGIEEIELPDTVTSIRTGAFMCCPFLKKIDMPNTLTFIGTSAFASCTNLEEISIPDALISLGGNAFYDCDKISEIHISNKLENVGFMTDSRMNGPFSNCDGLKNVSFGVVTNIPEYLFAGCTGLEEINVPASCKNIELYAFQNCSALSEVILPEGLEEIEYQAFYGCESLEEVELPDSVTYVGYSAFGECTSLKKVYLSSSIDSLSDNVFYNCTSLKDIEITESIKSIGDSCFYNCKSLEKIVIPGNVEIIGNSAFSHCELLSDLTISEGVNKIGANAFEYNNKLSTITLPNSLQSLGGMAFQYCKELKDVHLGAGITTILNYTFYENSSLESIVLPQQITQIDAFAFANCTKMTDITINRNVTTITANAFSYPAKLTIHGVAGTYAQTFAKENNIKFVELYTITTGIKLSKEVLELGRGNKERISAEITPEDSADELSWSSSDESILTVSSDGEIEAISGGTANVIATSGDVSVICVVNIYEPVSSVSVSPYSFEGIPGEQVQLEASVYPDYATYKDVEWSSKDNNVAKVDKNGLVTLIDYGETQIVATTKDMQRTDYCVIKVNPVSVTGVSLELENVTIQKNEQLNIVATITPENASNKNLIWTSSRPGIASVSDGIITGNNIGTATITVKTEDGDYTDSCTITVTEPTNLSSQRSSVVIDVESDEDGTKTVEPISFNIYNNTETDMVDVVASLENGTYYTVDIPNKIDANSSVAIVITPNSNLPIGYYEDSINIVSNDNTIIIPIKLTIKDKNNDAGNSGTGEGGNESGTGEGGNESGTGEGGNESGTGEGGNESGTGEGGNESGTGEGGNESGTGEGGNESGTGEGGNESGTGEGGNESGTGESGNRGGSDNGNNNQSTQPTSNPVLPTTPIAPPTIEQSQSNSNNTNEIQAKTPNKVKISAIKNRKTRSFIVTWKKAKNSIGYEIQFAQNKKFTKNKKVKTTTKMTLTVKKLKKGKTYYVRVRAYNNDSNGSKVYGKWSAVRKIKIKK